MSFGLSEELNIAVGLFIAWRGHLYQDFLPRSRNEGVAYLIMNQCPLSGLSWRSLSFCKRLENSTSLIYCTRFTVFSVMWVITYFVDVEVEDCVTVYVWLFV